MKIHSPKPAIKEWHHYTKTYRDLPYRYRDLPAHGNKPGNFSCGHCMASTHSLCSWQNHVTEAAWNSAHYLSEESPPPWTPKRVGVQTIPPKIAKKLLHPLGVTGDASKTVPWCFPYIWKCWLLHQLDITPADICWGHLEQYLASEELLAHFQVCKEQQQGNVLLTAGNGFHCR